MTANTAQLDFTCAFKRNQAPQSSFSFSTTLLNLFLVLLLIFLESVFV